MLVSKVFKRSRYGKAKEMGIQATFGDPKEA